MPKAAPPAAAEAAWIPSGDLLDALADLLVDQQPQRENLTLAATHERGEFAPPGHGFDLTSDTRQEPRPKRMARNAAGRV
jgi:hypothetical protein